MRSNDNKIIESITPTFIGNSLIYSIIAIFIVALVFSSIFSVDVLVSGEGKVIPTQEIPFVQASESGVIVGLHVKNGDDVKKGDVLFELDPKILESDLEKINREIVELKSDLAVHSALYQMRNLELPEELPFTDAPNYQNAFDNLASSFQSEVKVYEQKIKSKEEQLKAIKIKINSTNSSLALMTEAHDGKEKLLKKGFVSKVDFNRSKEMLLTKSAELNVFKQNLAEIESEIQALNKEKELFVQKFYTDRNNEIIRIGQNLNILNLDKGKLITRMGLLVVKAPVDGVVEDLKDLTQGSVVSVSQKLCKIVPPHQAYEMLVKLENKDIGFVNVGQNAEIILSAFPYGIYGSIPGIVKTISQDTTSLEGETQTFIAKVILEQNYISAKGLNINLIAGMAGVANIKTNRRTLIGYILSPIIECFKNSFREP